MRYKGKVLSAFYEKVLVIPRRDTVDAVTGEPGEDIVLKFQPVKDFDAFHKLCKEPIAPTILEPGKPLRHDETDPNYINARREYLTLQTQWYVINSISATKDLILDRVKLDDPTTWKEFDKELIESGFSSSEIGLIYQNAVEVNILTDESLNKARDRFLATQEAIHQSNLSLPDGPRNT